MSNPKTVEFAVNMAKKNKCGKNVKYKIGNTIHTVIYELAQNYSTEVLPIDCPIVTKALQFTVFLNLVGKKPLLYVKHCDISVLCY